MTDTGKIVRLRSSPSQQAERPEREGPVRLGRFRSALGFNLRLAHEASFQAFAKRTGKPEVKPLRYAMLAIIRDNPGLTQADLGRACKREKSSITPALKDLVGRGLVERRPNPNDGRVQTLRLTKKGAALTEKLEAAARMHDKFLEGCIGRENRELFLRLLSQIERAAVAYTTDD